MKFNINGGVCSFVTFNGGFGGVGRALEDFGAFNKKTLVQIYFHENEDDVPLDIFDLTDDCCRLMRTSLTKAQIDLILSFDTADQVMAYALSMYVPCMESYAYYEQKISQLAQS